MKDAPLTESDPNNKSVSTTTSNPARHRPSTKDVTMAMSTLVGPGSAHIGCVESIAVALGLPNASLAELRSVPGGQAGQRLLALRYLCKNGDVWLRYFSWENSLKKLQPEAPLHAQALFSRISALRSQVDETALGVEVSKRSLPEIAGDIDDLSSDAALRWIVGLDQSEVARRTLYDRFKKEGPGLVNEHGKAIDQIALLSHDLSRFPPTTVGSGELRYIIVADKGEMGVRAVKEAIAFGALPVVLYSEQDDARALQLRMAEEAGGFGIPLTGSFRETYANAGQIAEKIEAAYRKRFGSEAAIELSCSGLYPGYGPLAENTAAIELFRRSGIVFIGPMQDVVERAGDKRKFRLLAESIDKGATTPGIVMDGSSPEQIVAAIEEGAREEKFTLPGRLKAANGGGGRGQVVIESLDAVPAAVRKVLNEIEANGWDHGVMFEQNIYKTTHLEVQVVRDRFGNTRHFGMRDCTEQRASQKIQEEAPPAILQKSKELQERMCEIAIQIADKVGYVGACTVELMYKEGHFYLLEMNTRIQVEHPVTEEAHRIRRGSHLVPLNLVQLQFRVAQGKAIDFAQQDVVQTHVAREFRINAESYQAHIKDPRDGQLGLFLPNAGVFDRIEVPDSETVFAALSEANIKGISEVNVRFDCGFAVGDDLVNKDPTFGKLIVAIQVEDEVRDQAFELLRLTSILVLSKMSIEGRQLLPNGKILEDRPLATNIADHIAVLKMKMMIAHSQGGAVERHVNWLIEELRSQAKAALTA